MASATAQSRPAAPDRTPITRLTSHQMPSQPTSPLDRPLPPRPATRRSGRPGPAHARQPAPHQARAGWWLLPAIDLLASSRRAGRRSRSSAASTSSPPCRSRRCCSSRVNGMLGVYGAKPDRGAFGGEDGMAWPVIRLLVAALFAWSASLLTPLDGAVAARPLGGLRRARRGGARSSAPRPAPLDRVERWVLVGDEATAERLSAYEPLRAYATVVCTVPAQRGATRGDRAASRRSRWSTATTPTAS